MLPHPLLSMSTILLESFLLQRLGIPHFLLPSASSGGHCDHSSLFFQRHPVRLTRPHQDATQVATQDALGSVSLDWT